MIVNTPDGSFDLKTSDGCSSFLTFAPEFISLSTQGAELRPVADNIRTFHIVRALGQKLPPKSRAALAQEQKQALVDLCTRLCSPDSTSLGSWIKHGRLAEDRQELLDALVPWTQDADFCLLLLAGRGEGAFGALAQLCARCPSPSPNFLQTLYELSNNCLNISDGSNLKLLDETGLLAQIFRTCLLHPSELRVCEPALHVIKFVQRDPRYVRKHFSQTAGAGQALIQAIAALSNSGGHFVNGPGAPVADALRKLQLHMGMSQGVLTAAMSNTTLKICRGCSKEAPVGRALLKCARCHAAHYCDRSVNFWPTNTVHTHVFIHSART